MLCQCRQHGCANGGHGLSNTFVTMFNQLTDCEGVTNALTLQDGLQCAVFTFLGKIVNRRVADFFGRRGVDIRIFLTLS